MPKQVKRSAKQRKHWRSLSPFMRAKLRQTPLAKWAAKIRREFDYKCCKCNLTLNLEAHHIYPKSLYPLLKLDIDNGILLCIHCHDDMHKLLADDPIAYYFTIGELIEIRKKIKRLKSRNPSGYLYFQYTVLSPDKFQSDSLETELDTIEQSIQIQPKAKRKQKQLKKIQSISV